MEISAEVIILGIIHRLVKNFDRGPSDRGFLPYFLDPNFDQNFRMDACNEKG